MTSSAAELANGAVAREPVAAARPGYAALIVPIYVALCLLSLLPFALVAHPPIVDFANHSARLFLACNGTDPTVAAMYQYRLGIIPNLAVDLVNLPLCGRVAPGTVVAGVTIASLVLIYGSAWLIQRKLFGRPTAFLFLLPAIGLNLVTTMGYTNFLAGVGVAMLLIALALGREQNFRSLFLMCNAGGLVVFFCHIFALAFVLIVFFGLMMARAPRTVRGVTEAALRTAALFALPLALAAFVPGEGGRGLSIDYFGKIRMLVAPFMTQHAGVGIFGLALIAPLYLVLRSRLAELHPSLRMPLLLLAVFVALVPSGIQDAVDVDSRTLVALVYLFFTAMQPLSEERRITVAVALVSAALAAVQIWTIFAVWQPFNRDVAEFRQATSELPRGATVFSVSDADRRGGSAYPLAYGHLASYATIDRLIFNPLEFTGIGMQPLSATPRYAPLDTPAALPFTPKVAAKLKTPTDAFAKRASERNAEFALHWANRFDYVIFYHFGGNPNFDPAALTEIRRGSFFSILKVKKRGA